MNGAPDVWLVPVCGQPASSPVSGGGDGGSCSGLALVGGWVEDADGAQVGGGEREAVEEQAGAAVVDVVGGDADEEFAEGLLDGVVGGGGEEGEGALTRDALGGAGDGAAGVVVEVAELLVSHARAPDKLFVDSKAVPSLNATTYHGESR